MESLIMKSKINICLNNSSSIRQRQYNEEELIRNSTIIIQSNEDNIRSDYTDNLEELREIIRNQNQYIQQLQVRFHVNTPDILQSSTVEKLTEENKKLYLMIDNYK
ncbi:hypothetical protein I4U23_000789 [Adineta vaga]|nr:hypothetical protein I4U23_000789 [Adineta vaga]